MDKNRAYFKDLLAENAQEQLYEELFSLLAWYQSRYTDKAVSEKYDELVLLSGKLNALQQSNRLGTITLDELNMEMSRLNAAVLELLNGLPDLFFQRIADTDTAVATGAKKRYGIPASLGAGMFWMGSVIMGLIALGSLIQHNYVTFGFTVLATLICLPPAFDYLADKFGVSLSGSVRVLLIAALTSIGLSFAKPVEKKAPPQETEQPK